MKWPDPYSSGPLRDKKSIRGHLTNPRGNVTASALAPQSSNIRDVLQRAGNQNSRLHVWCFCATEPDTLSWTRSAAVAQPARIVPVRAHSPLVHSVSQIRPDKIFSVQKDVGVSVGSEQMLDVRVKLHFTILPVSTKRRNCWIFALHIWMKFSFLGLQVLAVLEKTPVLI